MRLKYDIVLQEVGDTIIAVPVGKEAEAAGLDSYLNLNDTGADIIELLRHDTTREDIIAALLQSYDAPEDVISQCVDELLDSISPMIDK